MKKNCGATQNKLKSFYGVVDVGIINLFSK
jgi:hypothetical protein